MTHLPAIPYSDEDRQLAREVVEELRPGEEPTQAQVEEILEEATGLALVLLGLPPIRRRRGERSTLEGP